MNFSYEVPAPGPAGQTTNSPRREAGNMETCVPRLSVAILLAVALAATPALAQKRYDPGATDTEIRLGNIVPYTGQFAEYGAFGRAEAAYVQMINDRGGVNGRKLTFVSLDSGSEVHTALSLAHQLVEQEKVLLLVGTWGTGINTAIRPYLNQQRVPHLFVASGAATFADPAQFPWTMAFHTSFQTEGAVYAKYILRSKPDAKIALLSSDYDDGKEWRLGVRDGLGDKAATMIVQEESFSYTADPATLDPLIATLKRSGAYVFLNMAVGKFATRAIRVAYDLGWHPLQLLPNASLSIAAFLEPAGLEKAKGIITNARSKGWTNPQDQRDPAVREFRDWMATYNPKASLRDANNVYGYEIAQTLVEVLKQCGDDLTRANVMRHATHLDLELGMLRPGIRLTTSPTDYRPIKQLYLIQFNGKDWVSLGEVVGG
jgi:branched-chain amino acid transport system substrate-binding protein